MALLLTLIVISVAVVAAVLIVTMLHLGTPGTLTLFLRFVAAAGIAAVGASVLYLVYGSGGGVASLAVGDMCMVLVPLLLLVAVRTLDGAAFLWPSIIAFLLAIGVAGVTAFVPLPGSLGVKVAVLAATCAACAWVAARSLALPASAMRIVAFASGGYAVFSVLRLLVAAVAGWGSRLYAAMFSFVPATVVGGLVVLALGVAVLQLRTASDPSPQARRDRAPGAIVVIGDWRLASAAYGPDRVRGLVRDLRAAARSLDPDAVDVPRGVEVSLSHAVVTLAEVARAEYGWSADEVALLADGVSTAAVRTHPVRLRSWRRGRSLRS